MKSVVGSICIGKFDEQTIKKIVKLSDNAVFIGTNFPLQNFDTINSDYEQAAELAIEHLIQLGHQKIAFIGAEEHDNLHGYRPYRTPVVNTYRDIMQYYQLFDEHYFFVDTNARLSVSLGETLTKQALASWGDELPTAILAANDAMAIGVMNELAAQQIKVPETISVVGINDLSFARYLNPPLTTVKTFTEEMGEVSVWRYYKNELKTRQLLNGLFWAQNLSLDNQRLNASANSRTYTMWGLSLWRRSFLFGLSKRVISWFWIGAI